MSKRRGSSTKPKLRVKAPRSVFSVRFSPDELEKLRIASEARGATLAGLVRKLVMDAVARVAGSPTLIETESRTSSPSSVVITGPIADAAAESQPRTSAAA